LGIQLATDTGTGILIVQAVDEFEPAEIERFLGALYRGVAGHAPLMLWDLSRAQLAPSFDVPSITSFIRRHRPDVPGYTAVVADQDVTYGLSRMGQAYMEGLPVDFQVFRNRDEALSWLKSKVSRSYDVSGGSDP